MQTKEYDGCYQKYIDEIDGIHKSIVKLAVIGIRYISCEDFSQHISSEGLHSNMNSEEEKGWCEIRKTVH